LKNFKKIISAPNGDGRPWILWIWNFSITREEMILQLNAILAQGFSGIIVRPGREMVPAYLSDEFFALFRIVLEKAQAHGVGIRIADDFSMSWSGCFSTQLDQNPRLRARQLVLAESPLLRSGETFEHATENPRDTIVLAARVKNQQVSLSEVKTIPLAADKPLVWKTPPGEWRIFVFKKRFVNDIGGGYLPNAYNTRSAQLYILTVLNVFKKRFSKYIGNTLKGFLTEMPAYRPSEGAIPWDDDLVVKFRTKYKKDLLKYLPVLFHDAPQAGRIRNQIFSYLDQSMYERFACPLEAWAKKSRLTQWVLCPERSIKPAGHPLVDGDFHTDRCLSSVGLQNLDGTEENYPFLRAMADCNAKEYQRGTVTIIGRSRNGSAATLQSLKNEILMSLIAGASPIIIDGCFFSLDQRSYLKTPHNPVWYRNFGDLFKPLCDYAARMHEVLRNVTFSRPVALFSPAPAIRATYTPATVETAQTGKEFMQKTVNALIRQTLDFDVLSEEYLVRCAVKTGGVFGRSDRKGKGVYQALVIPYAPLISRSVLVFLEKLVIKHGTVIFVNEAPKGTFEDGIVTGVGRRIEKLLNPKKSKSRVVALDDIERSLSEIPSRIKISAHEQEIPDLLCADGVGEGCSYYCFHNRSDRQEFVVRVEVPYEKRFVSIDCAAAQLVEIPEVQREGAVSRFTVRLMPQRTLVIVGSSSSIALQATRPGKGTISPFTALQRNYRVVLKNQWMFEAQTPNTLPLSNWNLRIGLSRERGGFSHLYESVFQVGTLPAECYFAVPDLNRNYTGMRGAESQIEISVNGMRVDRPVLPATASPSPDVTGASTPPTEAVSFIVPPEQMDLRFLFGAPVALFNVKNLLVKGFNRIALRTSSLVLDPQALLYPPLLLGPFSIMRGQSGWVIEKTQCTVGADSWTKYGFPYLSGVGVYRQLFEVPHQYNRLILRVLHVSGPADISINGKPVGKFLWQPIEADITHFCESKRNELVIAVANTIDNIVRMNGRPSGIMGDVCLDVS
jgi:hypothetical protein